MVNKPAILTKLGDSEEDILLGQHWRGKLTVGPPGTHPATGHGMMVRAVLNLGRNLLPRMSAMGARITPAGIFQVSWWDWDGVYYKNDDALGLTGTSVRDMMRQTCDACKLTDEERLLFFIELNKWITDRSNRPVGPY